MSNENREQDGIRLSKDERKNLLAQLERSSSRSESPELILQRAQQALTSGNITQARRLFDQIEAATPNVPGLDFLRDQIVKAEKQKKYQDNLHTTEEMLTRYIQQRKKPLAIMALDTLKEIAPQHPRLPEYEIWVRDLDQEAAQHQQAEAMAQNVRAALRSGDLREARRQVQQLERVDPLGSLSEQLAAEVAAAEHGQATREDISRVKQEIEELLQQGRVDDAERDLEQLQLMDLPKITIDTIRRRIDETRRRLTDESEARNVLERFEQQVAAQDWQGARDTSHDFSNRFPDDPRSTEMFNRASRLEAASRREQSLKQGIASLEQFISQGKRPEAELALKLLRSMRVDEAVLTQFEARIQAL